MQPGTHPRVAMVGPLHVDLFIRGSVPLEREVLNAWAGPSEVDLVVAGSLGYAALALARLDWAVELHSAVGADAFGDHITQALRGHDIDTRFVQRSEGQTAIAIYMLLFGGAKRPLTYRLPAFEPWVDPPAVMRPGEPVADLLVSSGLLHFPQMRHRGLAAAFAAARSAGVLTALDPQFPLVETPPPWLPHLSDVLLHVDVLLCDEHEARMIFDTTSIDVALQAAHACGPRIVVVKRGAAGSTVSAEGSVFDQPAVPMPEASVREAVGAGDAFDAGFLDSLTRGGTVPDAARQATAAAALSLTGRGGADGIVDRASVLDATARVPAASRRSGAASLGHPDEAVSR